MRYFLRMVGINRGDIMLKSLLSVKKFIAMLTAIVFCFLSIIGKISSTEFLSVFTLIVGFYYGQSTVKDSK